MAYTFGADVGDYIKFSTPLNLFGNNQQILVAGWFYPTTLTAGRGLWSYDTITGCDIHTTTSEVRLVLSRPTSSEFVTSGLGLTANEWTFLAMLGATGNVGPSDAWRVWRGNLTNPPAEVTVNNTVAPVGNRVGGNAFYIGSLGGGLAFQGDIDSVAYVSSNNVGVNSAFTVATNGVITQDEADFALRTWVWPIWLGDIFPSRVRQRNIEEIAYWSGLSQAHLRTTAVGASTHLSDLPVTINGATLSQQRAPRVARSAVYQCNAGIVRAA